MKVVFEISNIKNRQASVIGKIDFAESVKDRVDIKSALSADASLNDHLLWLWGRLKHERKYLKNLQQDGAQLVCRVKGVSGRIEVYPNGSEMLHLLNAKLVIEK